METNPVLSLLNTTADRFEKKYPRDHDLFVAGHVKIKAFISSEQLSLLAAVKEIIAGMIETGEPEVGIFLNAEEQAYNDALIDLIKQLEVTDTPT